MLASQIVFDWLEGLFSESAFFHHKKIPSLKNVNLMLEALGRPDKSFDWRIVVTGTAGKGTVCVMTEKIFLDQKLSVTTLISPHISKVNERIRINGTNISEALFVKNLAVIKNISETECLTLTYYEAIVLAGILVGKEQKSQILITEVGMGGEFDAVNAVLGKRIAALTFVGEDHMDVLGDLESIARTKSGIFTGDTVYAVSGEKVFQSILQEKLTQNLQKKRTLNGQKRNNGNLSNKKLSNKNLTNTVSADKSLEKIDLAVCLDKDWKEIKTLEIDFVKGVAQKMNKKIVRRICEKVLGHKKFETEKINLPARWEKIGKNIILDGAHSQPRIDYILPQIKKIKMKKVGIFAMTKNHDPEIFKSLKDFFEIIFWVDQIEGREFWTAFELREQLGFGNSDFSDPKKALAELQKKYPEYKIFVLGSFYLCGRVKRLLGDF